MPNYLSYSRDGQLLYHGPSAVDANVAPYKAALSDLIDAIDEVNGYIDLESGCSGEGAVVRACRAINKPIPPNLRKWLLDTSG